MKLISIVGARPQFIKAAVLSRALRQDHHEILVHTGQHYDDNLSAVFFQQLGMASPDYHLGIGSASHGMQTGDMLAGIEDVLLHEKPDWLLAYGDTNSTLAGALAAAKLHIKVAHVEAGLRSFNRRMPEEINRVLTDHISTLLLCPSQPAVDNLRAEGISTGVHIVGDVMHDALLWALESNPHSAGDILTQYGLQKNSYLLLTIHRAENTDHPRRLGAIIEALNAAEEDILWPIHPRTQNKMRDYGFQTRDHIRIIEPVGYFEMLILQAQSRRILTDSGGMQKEAYWLGVPCITLRDETEWVETVEAGWNTLVGASTSAITQAIHHWQPADAHPNIYGDGKAAEKIVEIIALS